MTEPSRRARLSLMGAVALAVGLFAAVPVGASFTDFGLLNTQFGSQFGIGGIGDPGGSETVHLPMNDELEATWSAEQVVPDTTIEVTLDVFNNSPVLGAGLAIAVTATNADEATTGAADAFRYSATVTAEGGSAQTLFGDPADPARGLAASAIPGDVLAHLAPRGSAPLADGASWDAGDSGSRATVTLYAYLPDPASMAALSSAETEMRITINGSSESGSFESGERG